jgi:hypothetical protein
MTQDNISPASKSFEDERRRQQNAHPDRELQIALEATFPASDPISLASAGTAGTGSGETDNDRQPSDAPLVDQALASARTNASTSPGEIVENIRALKAELASLRDRAAQFTSGNIGAVRSEGIVALNHVRSRVRRQPIKSVALAALAGYIFALSRR